MNYIIEILAFYDWLEWNPLPSSAICLWHSLMHMANKTGWQKEFTVPMGVLESKTGLKRTTVCEARNLVKQLGRIDWRSRNGNQCAVYALCPFGEHNTEHNADAMANTKLTQPRTQSRLLNKQKETKLNETKERDTPHTCEDTQKADEIIFPPVEDYSREMNECGDYYMNVNNTPISSEYQREILMRLQSGVDVMLIKECIKLSAKKHVSYFRKIMQNWFAEGTMTYKQYCEKHNSSVPANKSTDPEIGRAHV